MTESYKNSLNNLMRWMLPHIPYMKREQVQKNIQELLVFHCQAHDIKTSNNIQKLLKYLNIRVHKDTDEEFLEYCYNLYLYTENMPNE